MGTVNKLLIDGYEGLEVVSIVGMPGLGKTTLAKKVFMDPEVDYEYMIKLFVHVSKDFDKREVLLQILTSISVTNEQVNKMDEQQLEKHVYRELEGKRYLIVLDDVWGIGDWDKLKTIFPHNEKRCRILLTTRSESVARYANQNPESLYRLGLLKLETSRELLRLIVFQNVESFDELGKYETVIVRSCNGLPLALVLVASTLLNHPRSISWWEYVANSLKNHIGDDDTRPIHTMINFMYKHLPNYLKPCFLYFAVFSEGSEILAWKLVRLWISEGFITQSEDLSLEESAEQYLEELDRRRLIMVDQKRKNGRIKTCHMHYALREFCKKEGGVDDILQELKKTNIINSPTLDEYRRLHSNNPSVVEYISRTSSGKCVRSFLTFVKEETTVESELVSCIPKSFRLLKVLEIQCLIFNRFPADMCNLVLLKYVAISSTFSILPAAMSSLTNLQTLIIMTTSDTLDIKADLWKMQHFRHLHTNTSATLPTPSTNTKEWRHFPNENIQTLCTISPESCTKEVFDRARKLKKLGICGILTKLFEAHGMSSFLQQLCRFEELENLKLLNDDTNSKLYSLPREFPPRLKNLTLKNTRLEWREMSTLGKLKSLEVLKLREYAFQGSLWRMEEESFCNLRHLYVGQTDLVVWMYNEDPFPKLKSLELNGCTELACFPRKLADIRSLQTVVLHCVNPTVVSSVKGLRTEENCFRLSVYPPGL